MKRIIKTSLLLFVGFLIGILAHIVFWSNPAYSTIRVINESAKEIEYILINNHKYKFTQFIEPINKHMDIKFMAGGENGYDLTVKFKDGKLLKTVNGYIEPGYVTEERISDNQIVSKFISANSNIN